MIRSIWFFIKLALWAAALSWLLRHPGTVRIDLPPWRLETSVAVFAVILLAAGIVVLSIWRLGDIARIWKMQWQRWRETRGLNAITHGFVAIAAGDAASAVREAKRTARYLPKTPLRHLLLAQTEQMRGNRAEASKHFVALMQNPETGFLGLRGLLTQAIEAGKYDHALQLARQAHKNQPKSVAVWRYLFELEARSHQWDAAITLWRKLSGARAIARDLADEYAASILTEQARLAEREGDHAAARRLYKRAFGHKPDFIPAATGHIESLYKAGYRFLADRALLRAWEKNPHPDFPQLALRYNSDRPAKLTKILCRMATLHPNSAAAHRAQVEYALSHQLWGAAAGHARDMIRIEPTQNHYRLLQRVLQSLPANDSLLKLELRKLTEEYADTSKWAAEPAWICNECHRANHQWHANCPHCGEFHSQNWETPRAFVPAISRA